MALAVRLREDYDARHRRALAAKRPGSAASGSSPSTSSGMRDWVLAFNAAGPEGLIDGAKLPSLTARKCQR